MDNVTDEFSLARNKLAKDIIGEIVLSENSEGVIKKWRSIFKISQKKLANELSITPSVVSDYESGRRKSPGIKVIRKYIDALLKIDVERGGKIVRSFAKTNQSHPAISNAIVDIKEFSVGISANDFCKFLNAVPIVKTNLDNVVYGYTVVDSLKAITELSFSELVKLYGITTQRALVFTGVSTGRTPMVAIKLTNLKPALVVLHGLDVVDDIAKRIAEVENIPLSVCRMESVDKIIGKLKEIE
jgi:putative transcriptional regulator